MNKTKDILLAKRGRFYKRAITLSEKENLVYEVTEAYRLKTRATFSTRAPTGRIKWVVDHFIEIFHLIRQIGLRNTTRFLRYAASPKVIYVDCIKVVNINTKEQFLFRAEHGMPLATAYTEDDLVRYSCQPYDALAKDIASTFDLKKIYSKAQPLKLQYVAPVNSAEEVPIKPNSWIIAGAGNFCASMLVPSIINAGGEVVGVCSNVGVSAEVLASIFGIRYVFQSFEEMVNSKKIANNLLIATPPYSHPQHIKAAIEAGYKIYAEKPVAVNQAGITMLKPYENYDNCMIGFNRRFAPAVIAAVESSAYKLYRFPKIITYIVHLGEFSIAMATQNLGGGTTTGSCCHYLDLIEYLAQSRVKSFKVEGIKDTNNGLVDGYSFACVCSMENGSLATLVFVRSSKHPMDIRERVIISGDGLNIVINDFKEVSINGNKKTFWKSPKGWLNAMRHFHQVSPLSASPRTPTLSDGVHVNELTFAIDRAILNQLEGMSN